MKRFLKIVGVIVLVIVVFAAGAASYFYFKGIPTYKVEKVDLKVEVTPARVEQGQKIASFLCIKCHSDHEGKLTGKWLSDAPPEFGKIYSKNITSDEEKGIGSWTDGELYYLLRTGISRDGQYVPPYMVKFPNASDEDIYSIIAWLRSDQYCLKPSKEEAPETQPSLLTKFLCPSRFNKVFPPPQ